MNSDESEPNGKILYTFETVPSIIDSTTKSGYSTESPYYTCELAIGIHADKLSPQSLKYRIVDMSNNTTKTGTLPEIMPAQLGVTLWKNISFKFFPDSNKTRLELIDSSESTTSVDLFIDSISIYGNGLIQK